MAEIKVIEEASEVWWETTYEGIVEIDGVQIDYRFNENPNGITLYIYEEGDWSIDPSDEMSKLYDILYDRISDQLE